MQIKQCSLAGHLEDVLPRSQRARVFHPRWKGCVSAVEALRAVSL